MVCWRFRLSYGQYIWECLFHMMWTTKNTSLEVIWRVWFIVFCYILKICTKLKVASYRTCCQSYFFRGGGGDGSRYIMGQWRRVIIQTGTPHMCIWNVLYEEMKWNNKREFHSHLIKRENNKTYRLVYIAVCGWPSYLVNVADCGCPWLLVAVKQCVPLCCCLYMFVAAYSCRWSCLNSCCCMKACGCLLLRAASINVCGYGCFRPWLVIRFCSWPTKQHNWRTP